MTTKRLLIVAITLLACATSNYAQDWPQFLGPNRNSTSSQKNILRVWPATGPEILWSANVGIGYGGPVVKDGKVYLLDRDDTKGDIMRCFNLSNGNELWQLSYDAPGTVMFPGSRSVPAIDGNYIYSCGHNGDLYCVDVNARKTVWKKNIWTDYGGDKLPTWAISQCPLVYGNLLIIASQAPQAGVVAYNKLTGEVKWKTPSLGLVGYVSPTIVKIDGNDHLVMITASSREEKGNVIGMEPLTGKILWKYSNWNCRIPVPSAFDAGENRLLIIGGYELGATMIKVAKGNDGNYATTELFVTTEFGDQTKPPIMHNGYFYAQYGTNNKRDGLVCMDMEGKVRWKTKRAPDFNKGSLILADGLILATDGAKSIYLIEPDPNAFKVISSAELLQEQDKQGDELIARHGTQNWAPIALADGKLLIRDQSRLLCVKVAK